MAFLRALGPSNSSWTSGYYSVCLSCAEFGMVSNGLACHSGLAIQASFHGSLQNSWIMNGWCTRMRAP
eukprot:1147780-Pelagomonas_calceolata.AAC.6